MKLLLDFLQLVVGYYFIFKAVYSFREYDSKIKAFSKRYWVTIGLVLIGGIIIRL